jgi:hypothetical protein
MSRQSKQRHDELQGTTGRDCDANVTPRDWPVRALPRCLARLHRLQAASAPEIVLEWERSLIRRVLARLPPAEGLAILGRWRELHERLERGGSHGPRHQACSN